MLVPYKMSGKRARTDSGSYDRRKRAIAIAARMNSKYPYSEYGRVFRKRGTPENVSLYGATFRDADERQRAQRKFDGYYGRGRYGIGKFFRSDIGKRVTRAALGAGTGYMQGGAAGAAMGAASGFIGSGSYANSLVTGTSGAEIPHFVGAGDETGAVQITKTEFVRDIFGPDGTSSDMPGFVNETFPINPGIGQTFRWVSQIAANYDEYELKQCMFYYRATMAEGNLDSVATICMATNYNVQSPPFQDKDSIMSYAHAMSCKASENMTHGVECDPGKLSGHSGKYVRVAPLNDRADISSYDHGNFQIAIVNCPPDLANRQLGELWVAYTLELRKPKSVVSRGLTISRDVFVTKGKTNFLRPLGAVSTESAPSSNFGYLLKGQQNTLGCVIRPNNLIVGNNYATISHIEFPPFYAGYIEILVQGIGDFSNTHISTADDHFINPNSGLHGTTGNIEKVYDMYADFPGGGIETGGLSPNWIQQTLVKHTSGAFTCRMHFKISRSTNGVRNVLYMVHDLADSTDSSAVEIDQVEMVIQEYNTIGTYRHQNISATDVPILVDGVGSVVVPDRE